VLCAWRQCFVDPAKIVVGNVSDTAAAWFSSFLLKALVSRVKRREDIRTDRCRPESG
jgi:hypothetical protein